MKADGGAPVDCSSVAGRATDRRASAGDLGGVATHQLSPANAPATTRTAKILRGLERDHVRANNRRTVYWHVAILKDAIRVLQLNIPSDFKYWPVYHKVQSSTGSTLMCV